MMWMSAVGALWLLLEPSRRSDEMLHEARIRVSGALVRDPLLWIFLGLVVFAGLRALNGGIVRIYDPGLGKWLVDGPSCSFWPGGVDGSRLMPFSTVLALAVAIEGCRVALGKSARIAFAATVSIAAAAAAIAAVVACGFGCESALRAAGLEAGSWSLTASSDRLISSTGCAYGVCVLAGVVALAGLFECKWNKFLLLFAVGLGGAEAGLFFFSSPAELLLFTVLALLFVIGSAVYLGLTLRSADVFKFIAMILISLLVPVMLAVCIAPSDMVQAHGAFVMNMADFPGNLFPEGFWERRSALSGFAADFWREAPWKGTGIGAFPIRLWLAGASVSGVSSHSTLNGWWALLSERGLLGALALTVPLGFMCYSLVRRAILAFGRHVFLPLVALGVVGLLATAAAGFVETSMLRADLMLVVGAFFALAASSFPVPRRKTVEEDGGAEESSEGKE